MASSTVVLDYGSQVGTELSIAMGKSQKFSRGYNTGFVPDYRIAVETMGESDGAGFRNAVNSDSGGVGSSGRIDMEMTASEDSYAPKRKCISLNVDRCEGFSVPLQVLAISKMSRSEKRELQRRLSVELEQVRILQRKMLSRCSNGVALSAYSNIRSCNDMQRKPATESFQIGPLGRVDGREQRREQRMNGQLCVDSSEWQGRKKLPANRDGAHTKRGPFGRSESANGPAACKSDTMLMKQCETLLKRLMSHQFGWVFNIPVDPVKLNLPDYFDVIKHPMDLGTVKTRISLGAYSSPLGFAADVRLTFSNAMTYNPPKNDVHLMADTLSKFFEVRWKTIEKKIPVANSQVTSSQCIDSIPMRSVGSKGIEASTRPSELKKRKSSSLNQKMKPEITQQIMTDAEKQKLTRDLESLPGDMPEHIIDFLRTSSQNASQANGDEIEIDIDALGNDTLFKLRKLLDDYLQQQQSHQAKAEPCEVEILNHSGLSNSSMHPGKGNDPADEDVDIGGNDFPISSYPPVEIEKDAALRSSKCSSSSCSSSDSASSSSGSDSGSSSGNESHGAKVSSPGNTAKEPVSSGEALDQKKSDHSDTHDGDLSVSGLKEFEPNVHPSSVSVGADGHHEGEISERQVSPEKIYRAALLRSRFADTIIKAREKRLDQVDKGDPEKLRREREELERLQREEKARLQAEAKAAEEARKQSEAEATAEAKRKRELEREAARLALQKMEKTVEINENCQFLKDLEMLRSAPPEHIPSSVDETSPDHSLDGLGMFKLQGSNPLEQLGLYMKMDDEEEEETEPVSKVPTNEVEEGEID